MSSLRRIILWDHQRGSWQYDIFCLLIIGFIFLTPPSWFNDSESIATQRRVDVVKTPDTLFGTSNIVQTFDVLAKQMTPPVILRENISNDGLGIEKAAKP